MANHELRTIIAQSLEIIHQDTGYIAPAKHSALNTQSKVLAILSKTNKPVLEITYWQLADEIVDFFRNLTKHPDYKLIMEREDATAFHTCMNAAQSDETSTVNFGYAVLMPHLYGKLKPKKARVLNPNQTEAKLIQPGEFMGTLNVQDRFFVKLVYVEKPDATKGTLFELRDRNNNIGFFHDRAEKWENKIQLGDCFAMHATPARHTPADNGEKHTIFRNVEFIAGSVTEGKAVDPSNDKSDGGKFSKGKGF